MTVRKTKTSNTRDIPEKCWVDVLGETSRAVVAPESKSPRRSHYPKTPFCQVLFYRNVAWMNDPSRLSDLQSRIRSISFKDLPLNEAEVKNITTLLPGIEALSFSTLKASFHKDVIRFIGQFLSIYPGIKALKFNGLLRINDEDVTEVLRLSSNITRLDLSKTKITGESLHTDGFYGSLRMLDISYTALTDEGVVHILNYMPGLNIINMSGNPVTLSRLDTVLMPHIYLETVIVKNTAIRSEGIENLKSYCPNAEIKGYKKDL